MVRRGGSCFFRLRLLFSNFVLRSYLPIYYHNSAPGDSPESLTAYNTSSSSIYAGWQEIVADKQHGIMQGYKLFLYEVTKESGLQSLVNHTYDLAVREANFMELKMYAKHRIEVLGFNNFGDGPVAAVELFTDEGG